jgi:uncharacterized protein YbaR (Trm112 family)
MATRSAAAPPGPFFIGRRRFLTTSSAVVATGLLGADGADVAAKPRRVGLIGAGWYGKSDLWRLVQVAPVEIVALADPDRRMLEALVCPVTQDTLSYDAARQELVSRAIGLAFPIRDGIPIMLVSEAREIG